MRFPILTLLLIFASTTLYAKQLVLNVAADSAIVVNPDTGAILYEKNSRRLQYAASTTKIATVLYALKKKGDQLDSQLTAEQDLIASISYQEKRRATSHFLPIGLIKRVLIWG